jgi:hypothetical protein
MVFPINSRIVTYRASPAPRSFGAGTTAIVQTRMTGSPPCVETHPAVIGFIVLSHTAELPLVVLEARKLVFALLIGLVIVRVDAAASARVLQSTAVVGRTGYSLYAFHMPILIALMIAGAPFWACVAATFAAAFIG